VYQVIFRQFVQDQFEFEFITAVFILFAEKRGCSSRWKLGTVNLLSAIGFLQTNSAGEPWTNGVEKVPAKPGKYQFLMPNKNININSTEPNQNYLNPPFF
jgi:hypothetical protein